MIPLYGVTAHGGKILQLDDESVYADQQEPYTPYLVSTNIDVGAGGYGRLRRVVQNVIHTGQVTVEITPYRDGMESGATIARDLSIGENGTVDAPMAVGATRFGVKIALSLFDAAVELGKAELYVIPRRSQR